MDNIRLYFNDRHALQSIMANKNYNEKWVYNAKSCSPSYPVKYDIENLVCIIDDEHAYLENSIHKYYNSKMNRGRINHNDFTYCQILKAFDELFCDVNYDLDDTQISSLEFGFNLRVQERASDIIRRFFMFKFKSHRLNEDEKTISMRKFKMTNYQFKIYDKALQEGLDYHLLRIEIIYKSKELKRIGISNPCDLFNPLVFKNMFNDFMEKFDHLMIVDDRFNCGLSESQIRELGNMLEPTFWKQKFSNAKQQSRYRTKLKSLIKKYQLDSTKTMLTKMLRNKFDEVFVDCAGKNPLTNL